MKNLSWLLLLFVGCTGGEFKESKTFIGNQKVDADTLNLGKQVYMEYCSACHGLKGDGNGAAAKGSFPPPRNFKQGLYKFGHVADGGLPTDADFKNIIQKGLKGTAMLPWDISDQQTYAVTQYIKTFAPQVWEKMDEQEPGKSLTFTKDPYGLARKEYAIKKGEKVYHQVASCQSCHRAYLGQDDLNKLSVDSGQGEIEFDPDAFKVKLQTSEFYYYDSEDRTAQFIPPDFTFHEVRSASSVEELYQRIASGVTGTGMPAWQGTIEEDEIWAVAYYVRSLIDIKENHQRKEFMSNIEKQNEAYKK